MAQHNPSGDFVHISTVLDALLRRWAALGYIDRARLDAYLRRLPKRRAA